MTDASATPTHLVDQLNKASLFDLALDQGHPAGPGRGYVLPSKEHLAGLFADLEIQELIGFGGMGCVYRARQARLDRVIALKILPKELAKDELFAERFAREARAMARLTHPNVIRVYDFGSVGDICYLIMEHLDGMNLRELLNAGPMSCDEAFRIFEQVASALEYAHLEGVIHRDIKPENILFSRAGHVFLADFGLARLAMDSGCEVSLTQTRQAMGTLNYMAPEQWDNPKSVDHRVDIYAMGVLLYEMLTGRVPRGSFPPASTLASVSPGVDEIIHKALQVDEEKRFSSVHEMSAALSNAVAEIDETSAQHHGTFTRVANFAGVLARRTPSPAHLIARPFPDSIREPAFGVSLFLTLGVLGCMVLPWHLDAGATQPGFVTGTLIGKVEVPNAFILGAMISVTFLMKFRKYVHPLRAHLVSFVLTGAGIALAAFVIGEPRSRTLYGSDFNVSDGRMTPVPFFVLGLLIFQLVEIIVRLVQMLIHSTIVQVLNPFRKTDRAGSEQGEKEAASIHGSR